MISSSSKLEISLFPTTSTPFWFRCCISIWWNYLQDLSPLYS